MATTNLIRDQVSTLDLQLFRDNAFRRVFVLPVDFILPEVVSSFVYTSANGSKLSVNSQPTITLVGRNLTLEYPHPERLPELAFHQILFDGRVVWAGQVRVSRNTSLLTTPESGVVLIITAPGVSVSVPYTGDILTLGFRNDALEAAGQAEEVLEQAQAIQQSIGAVLSQYVLLTLIQQNYSTTSQMNAAIQTAVNTLVSGAPGFLDTFNEIATALGNDPSFATTILNLLGGKQDKVAGKGLSQENFTTTLLNKLNGIATGATANSTDAQLRDRTFQTGVQSIGTITGLQGILDAKAESSALTSYSTTTQVQNLISSAINGLVNSSPGTLDTLKELADALGDDPHFSTTITNLIAAAQATANAALPASTYNTNRTADQAATANAQSTASTALGNSTTNASAIVALQNGKADLAFTASMVDTSLVATGAGNKLIIEVISGTLTLYVYSSTASPTLQKLLTYTNS